MVLVKIKWTMAVSGSCMTVDPCAPIGAPIAISL